MKQIKGKPEKVQRIVCPMCGELQVKVYPWSTMRVLDGKIPPCQKHVGKIPGLLAVKK